MFILWQFRVAETISLEHEGSLWKQKVWSPGRSVGSKALDEESHGDDEADAHEEDTVPVGLKKDKG